MEEIHVLAKEYCEIVKSKTGEIISIDRALDEMKQFSQLLDLLHKTNCKMQLQNTTLDSVIDANK